MKIQKTKFKGLKMTLTSLTAISPIDGRYNSKTDVLQKYFSESKIGELVKIIYASYIREGHNLVIRNSDDK